MPSTASLTASDSVGWAKTLRATSSAVRSHFWARVTELLPVLTLAQKWDLTADEVARNVFAHPTLSEAVKEAVEGIVGHMINF